MQGRWDEYGYGQRSLLVRSLVKHGLDGEGHPRLHHADGFVSRVMGNVGSAVEQASDAVPAEIFHHAVPPRAASLLDRLPDA